MLKEKPKMQQKNLDEGYGRVPVIYHARFINMTTDEENNKKEIV